jgi:hypothetical protein
VSPDPFARYFIKRAAFRHEAEYRAVAPFPHLLMEDGVIEGENPPSDGVYVEIDLPAVVQEVVIAPNAPLWFREAATATCERFAMTAPIRTSSLGDPAVF